MRLPPCIAALAFLLPNAAAAAMGFGNVAPVVDAVAVSPAPAVAGAAATITCSAHDDGGIGSMQISASGGSLDTATPAIVPAPSVSASVTWTAPAPGAYSITCTVRDNDGLFGSSAQASLTVPVDVVATAATPVIDSLTASATQLLAGQQARVVVAAHDPQGGALAYSWSAGCGALTATGPQADWQSPPAAGTCTVAVDVSSAAGSTSASLGIAVLLRRYEGAFAGEIETPRRLAVADSGEAYVIDGRTGRLLLATVLGEVMGAAQLDAPALAVAAGGGRVFAATADGKIVEVDPRLGTPRASIAPAGGPFLGPSGLAFAADRGLLFLSERDAGRVRAIRPDGGLAFSLTAAGATPLAAPVDVAVDRANGLVWVLLESNEAGPLAHAFTLDGAYVRSLALFGAGPGQLTRGGGLAIDAEGKLFATDLFQGRVQAFDAAGASLGAIGNFGSGPGELRQPSGIAAASGGDLLVANLGAGRIERFGAGARRAACPGDSDCDGMPDWWEIAHGLNPNWAGDALLDPDHDGLVNLLEYAYGTDPRNPDTDGDGYLDGEEVAAGFNPLDPYDHKPRLYLGGPAETDPGLVRLSAQLVAAAGARCSLAWTQSAGPAVPLRTATSSGASFVARRPGAYAFDAVATCGRAKSDPARARVTVRNVAPMADPGRIQVVHAGRTFLLDGSFSSDANADPLALRWDQTLGQPLVAPSTSAEIAARSEEPGFLQFMLTATDPGGARDAREVGVVVADSGEPAPTAVAATPLLGEVGRAVPLLASGSPGPRLAFRWTQLDGPPASLDAPRSAAPSFTPAAAGRYVFEVTVSREERQSPPARVEVFVAPAGKALPRAVASAAISAAPGAAVELDGSSSAPGQPGGALAYRWRQLSGPAAGLGDADRPVATVVPFDPGSAVFELSVEEDGVPGVPAQVRLDAGPIPLAVATAPALAAVRDLVRLDGTRSSSASGGALRYRWTQVDGPWTPLGDPAGARPAFRPKAPGLYRFELEVSDGGVRSAPAPVSILVFGTPSGKGGDR